MKKNNIILHTVLGLLGLWLLLSLRQTNYPQEVTSICGFIFDYMTQTANSISAVDVPPESFHNFIFCIRFMLALLLMAFGILSVTLFKYKTADFSAGIYLNICSIIKIGLSFVLLNAILVVMFLSSVIGTAAAFLIILSVIITSILGLIPFSVALGSYLQKLYNGNSRNIFSNFIIGFLFVSVCCNIYGFSGPMMFFVFPVIGTGSFLFSAHNMLINRHFDISLAGIIQEGFDRNSIRNIITKDIN